MFKLTLTKINKWFRSVFHC